MVYADFDRRDHLVSIRPLRAVRKSSVGERYWRPPYYGISLVATLMI
jgi:hypothetical protein